MTAFPTMMQTLLDTAEVAALTVTDAPLRAYFAGGPQWAKECKAVVVHPMQVQTDTGSGAAVQFGSGGNCFRRARPQWGVTYVADCYPALRDAGGDVSLPNAAEISAWTVEYVATWEAVYRALLDLGVDDPDGPLGECEGISLLPAQFFGPLGGMAWVTFPVQINDA